MLDQLIYVKDLSDSEKLLFQSEYSQQQKKPINGQLWAFFLGGVGAHHFYLGNTGLGVVYALTFWTGLPAFAALIEIFLMKGKCDKINAELAHNIAIRIKGMRSASPVTHAAPKAA